MKKVVTIAILLMMMVIFGCSQVYAAENIIDQQNESKIVQIKVSTVKILEVYKQKIK